MNLAGLRRLTVRHCSNEIYSLDKEGGTTYGA